MAELEITEVEQADDASLVNEITAIVREVDRRFERVGGSSRHWTRDCFLPALNDTGFTVVKAITPTALEFEIREEADRRLADPDPMQQRFADGLLWCADKLRGRKIEALVAVAEPER